MGNIPRTNCEIVNLLLYLRVESSKAINNKHIAFNKAFKQNKITRENIKNVRLI